MNDKTKTAKQRFTIPKRDLEANKPDEAALQEAVTVGVDPVHNAPPKPAEEDADSVQVCEPVRNPLALRTNNIIADAALNHKRHPSVQTLVKIPKEVEEFIKSYAEEHANKSAIYYRMLQLGAKAMAEEMTKGDYMIRLKPVKLPPGDRD